VHATEQTARAHAGIKFTDIMNVQVDLAKAGWQSMPTAMYWGETAAAVATLNNTRQRHSE
jgi:hypothetical protein